MITVAPSGPPGVAAGRQGPLRAPFAPDAASLPDMRKAKPQPDPDPLAAPIRGAVRTPLFWLLYEHHEALAANWRGHRVKWPDVCAWATAHGVSDKRGNAIKPTAAKKAWVRVQALKAREQAEREAKRRPSIHPTPRQTLPPPVATPRALPPDRSHPAPAQGTGQVDEADLERRMALTQATINRRSGRPA